MCVCTYTYVDVCMHAHTLSGGHTKALQNDRDRI